jgi:D-xylose 1-dehydrogenase (NADP+, D-xylono-1,5-lactone-forming)
MSEKIRWGILSTASIGYRRVVPAIQQSRNGVVTAVASRDLAKAKQFAADRNIPKAYGNYEELIADPDIDAIYNPLPNSEHAVWSIKCAEAGKATLCEKPLASDTAEARIMVDAFVSRGVPFTEGFMYRFHPQTVKVEQLIEDGAIGDINVMQATFTFTIRDAGNIRLSKALAGGSLMDVGCYCVNVMRFMTGEEPTSARAIAEMGVQTGVDEKFNGILQFPSGATGHFDSGLHSFRTHTYEIRGAKGRIYVGEGFVAEPYTEPVIQLWQEGAYHQIKITPVNQYTLMAEDFADALLNNRPPRYAPQDGVNTMKAIDMLKAAASQA